MALFTLTSALHDQNRVDSSTREFLDSLGIGFDVKGTDFSEYGRNTLDLIFVRTGGTESVFKPLLPQLLAQNDNPILLLTNGKSNSLAASLEILSYLRQQGIKGEILHGTADYIRERIRTLIRISEARNTLKGSRIGVIGKPSDWLIASEADADALKDKFGIEMVNVPMQELLEEFARTSPEEKDEDRIYLAIKSLVGKYGLKGFTIRCFDLLTSVHSTGCLALAKLNAEGIVSGCEGDVPALLSMMIVNAATGISGFQANPAEIDPQSGEMILAHCTIPLNMVESYELDTHFESGIGVAIRGRMKTGPVTLFKISGDLKRCFAAEGELICNMSEKDLCRTQLKIKLDKAQDAQYFLTDPIGNHHIVVPGRCSEVLKKTAGF